MTGERFSEAFFEETVTRLAKGARARSVVRTPLSMLYTLDKESSLEPSGIIFHMGRCGSTLLARQLGLVEGVVSVREPQLINTLLGATSELIDGSSQVQILRLLVRALGRVRFGDERYFVLKLSSWNILKAALFRLAFPTVPMIWVQRRPVEVMASMIKEAPSWLVQNHPSQTAQFFGIDPETVKGKDGFEFAARLLASMLTAAEDTNALVIDYEDLPGAIPDIVAPYFGIPVNAVERAEMQEQSRYYAKSNAAVPFTDDSNHKREVPERAAAVSAAFLDESYARLKERRPKN